MKRIIVVCEGPTEQEFSNKILSPFFSPLGISLSAPLIKRSNGGIVPWSHLKNQIELHLKSERGAYVTTFIDYYGIYDHHKFPRWEETKQESDVSARVRAIEQGMYDSIDESLRSRFIPYIQLHEFEGLLFSDGNAFERVIPSNDLIGKDELKKTLDKFDNPEMINSSRLTSPSHRIERIIRGYNKVVYGNYLAESIGLSMIRKRCPRFNDWIERLANVQ